MKKHISLLLLCPSYCTDFAGKLRCSCHHANRKSTCVVEYSGLKVNLEQRHNSLERADFEKVWGFDYDGDPRTVDTHIKRLREKLLDQKDLIQNVRYRTSMKSSKEFL